MKISQEEIDAAIVAYNGSILTVVGRKQINGMTAALTAAITVRKGRKAAKRERQRKEKNKQVVESVKPVFGKLDGDCFASAFDAAMKPKA